MIATKTKRGFAPVMILLLALGTLVVGGGSYVAAKKVEERKSEKAAEQADSLPTALSGVKSAEEIRALAEKLLKDGQTIVSIELEDEDAGLVYKVKLGNPEGVLFFNAETGEQIIDPSEDKADSDEVESSDEIPADFVAAISVAQARSIAEGQRPGKTVRKIELDMEESKVVYSVKFTDDGRVDVDATTGAVLRVREPGSSGNDDNGDDQGDDQGGNSEPQEMSVSMEDNEFSGLESLTKGQAVKVEVENEDDVSHTFTITELGINYTIAAGAKKEFTFTPSVAGSFTVKCTIHPEMTASITVKNS
ncbi:hypothetical protein A3A71_00255 [Candidatus Berkelbacteria bacterium RIFCSPLOWO2_01_FULL_50_28]|uniref:EfeO-type cupredoxin-like domain-containing protein n=1 Tax=Candidatus Berkelbacteria bacterium RIFCSPLOWO2_01_FULL_50_28 TaxID=1797471 RepID=A0A1F5EAV9_9BACT|nr:MAG: hypothetical protein A2807_00185 [Candidatus Berkelbacteria bacterium RIFCSPHIGHO2_01_FULL_50_36]OGD62825.1 MAG: hypothetical protein A3F39_02255 [Candidatus Berkelbacteria bacterium RIFCSPHIGHO2_12_FULL_50_11]OGD64481.1 MAG: hypothetical protein A3A71_00255 [Candidatus Berkelbacteria bacterium RIFCSPLOWO2_01_FULL_50_28]